jgi:hypothetical protein
MANPSKMGGIDFNRLVSILLHFLKMKFKREIALLFISILFIGQTGYHSFCAITRMQAKQAIKAQIISGLPDSSLDIIEDSRAINWFEQDKEFLLHQTMYDVVRIKIINEKKLFFCINDEKEQQIIQKSLKAAEDANDSRGAGKGARNLLKLQLSDFICPETHCMQYGNTKQHLTPVLHIPLVSPIQEVQPRPPKV